MGEFDVGGGFTGSRAQGFDDFQCAFVDYVYGFEFVTIKQSDVMIAQLISRGVSVLLSVDFS